MKREEILNTQHTELEDAYNKRVSEIEAEKLVLQSEVKDKLDLVEIDKNAAIQKRQALKEFRQQRALTPIIKQTSAKQMSVELNEILNVGVPTTDGSAVRKIDLEKKVDNTNIKTQTDDLGIRTIDIGREIKGDQVYGKGAKGDIQIGRDYSPQLGSKFTIENLSDPINDQDAATKAYVDSTRKAINNYVDSSITKTILEMLEVLNTTPEQRENIKKMFEKSEEINE